MSPVVEVEGVGVSPEHWIGGKRVPSAERFPVHSPIDGAHLADLARGGSEDVDRAVEAARAAFPAWAALGPEERATVLHRFAEGLLSRREELAAVETRDNGSLLLGNLHRVIARAAHNISFFADWAKHLGDTIESETARNHVRYEPSGVAALVTPWNAPLMLTTWKVGPALAAGSTVVVKPPEWAPLTCSLMADVAAEAGVPDGVVNVVQGIGEEAGAALVAHPGVDRISFTGSTDTARLIGRSAAENLTPVSFELGGKSPFVVFADADLDSAVQNVAAQYFNAGQVCLAGTRVFVEAPIAEEFRSELGVAVSRLRVGDPREPETRIGPLVTPEHFGRVEGFVRRALDAGARPVWGGGRDAAGELYFEPTLLDGVSPDMEIFRREVFGPVLSWHTFSGEEEAIRLANSTDYGLAAMVFTRDEERARRVAAAVVAGTVWVNCFFVRDLAAPFGGARRSGIGREGGSWSFDFFCDVKNVCIQRDSFTREGNDG